MNTTPLSPSPATQTNDNVASTPTTTGPSLSELTKLYELGIVSKEKLKEVVSQLFPDRPAVATPTPAPPVETYTPASARPCKRKFVSTKKKPETQKVDLSSDDFSEPSAASASPPTPPSQKQNKQRRVSRSSPTTLTLRKLAKDPTRRRFFEQCLNLQSVLWHKFGGAKKEINVVLFARAAKAPMDELYSAHPGVLHSVSHNKLREVIKWQVCCFCCCVFLVSLFYFCFVCVIFVCFNFLFLH